MKCQLILIFLMLIFTACKTSQNIIDTDLDGVVNTKDVCPKKAGSPFNLGCPLNQVSTKYNKEKSTDNDLDGILNDKDECPYTYGSPFNLGCP